MPSPTLTPQVRRYPELESLRGLMAWLVVSSHVFAQAGYHDRPMPWGTSLLRNRGLGVEVFVILSGFVIFHLLHTRAEPYGEFMFRRAARLYPACLVALAAGLAMSPHNAAVLDALPWRDGPTLQVIKANWTASQQFFWPHLALHLVLLHGLLPNEVLPYSTSAFLDPAWSIFLEWQFYLLAPALLGIFRLYRTLGVLAFAATVMLCVKAQPYFGDFSHPGRLATWHLKAFLPLMLQFFAVGIASFYFLRWIERRSIQLPPFAVLFVVAIAYVIGLPLSLSLWIVMLAIVASHLQPLPDPVTATVIRLLRSRVLSYFGRTSYSTYLLHIPVIYSMTWLLVHFGFVRGPAQFLVTLATLTVIGTVVLSHLCFNWVERPAMDRAARFLDSRRSAALSNAA